MTNDVVCPGCGGLAIAEPPMTRTADGVTTVTTPVRCRSGECYTDTRTYGKVNRRATTYFTTAPAEKASPKPKRGPGCPPKQVARERKRCDGAARRKAHHHHAIPKERSDALRERLLAELERVGMQRKELAVEVGLSVSHMSLMLNGTRPIGRPAAERIEAWLGKRVSRG